MAVTTHDPRTIMRLRPMKPSQYGVIGLCMLINMIDGYDILALSLAASALSREWSLSATALGTLLSMNLVGMALGALGVSPVADQWGRRPAILTSLAFMSVGMALAALAIGFYSMAAARIVTGIGIGGMTSTAGMLALEYASQKRREVASSVVASAYPVGTIIGSFVAIAVLDGYGWRGIFWVGAGMSALLWPVAYLWLPESLDFLLIRQPNRALALTNGILRRVAVAEIAELPAKPADTGPSVVKEIRQPRHVRELLKLFLAHALNMFSWYFILNWGPKLVAAALGTDEAGAFYSSWLSYGGIAGALAAGYLCGTLGVRRTMWFTMVSLAVLIALVGIFAGDRGTLMIIAPLVGAALFGSATANWLTIAYAFPPQLRATGLGLGTTAGRVGSIFGPMVGGVLLDQGLTTGMVCMAMAVPAILSALTFSQARQVEPGR